MKNIKSNIKQIIKPVAIIIAIILVYISINSVAIYYYLHQFGYGIKELPQTVAVWMGLSDGFTVSQNGNEFIGRSNFSYYMKLCEKKGYCVEQEGSAFIASNSQKCYKSIFFGLDTDVWCHWFRLYDICSDDGEITLNDFEKID